MTTTTRTRSVQEVLDNANPNELGPALAKAKLGTTLAPLRRVFTGLAAAASFDLTAIDATGETPGAANPKRLAALSVTALQVTASGTATSLGAYIAADSSATAIVPPGGAGAAVGVAKISDDGKTITFPNTVTGFTIQYIPRVLSSTDMAAHFAPAD